MNKIEANDLILVSRHAMLEIKDIVNKTSTLDPKVFVWLTQWNTISSTFLFN